MIQPSVYGFCLVSPSWVQLLAMSEINIELMYFKSNKPYIDSSKTLKYFSCMNFYTGLNSCDSYYYPIFSPHVTVAHDLLSRAFLWFTPLLYIVFILYIHLNTFLGLNTNICVFTSQISVHCMGSLGWRNSML